MKNKMLKISILIFALLNSSNFLSSSQVPYTQQPPQNQTITCNACLCCPSSQCCQAPQCCQNCTFCNHHVSCCNTSCLPACILKLLGRNPQTRGTNFPSAEGLDSHRPSPIRQYVPPLMSGNEGPST